MEITKEIRGKENFTIDILKDGETIAIQIRLDDNCNNYIEYHFCWEEPCKFIHCKMTRTTIGDILCWGGRYFREDYFLSYILPKAGKIFVYPGDWECWSAEHTEEKVEIIEAKDGTVFALASNGMPTTPLLIPTADCCPGGGATY